MNQARFGEGLFLLAVDYGERAMRLARAAEWPEQLAFILNDLADIYFESGQLEKGKAVLQEAHTLFRTMNNLPMLADNLVLTGSFYTWTGEFDKALQRFDEALVLAERIQNEWIQGFARGWRGTVWWLLGDYAAAIDDWESGAAFADRAGFLIGQYVPRILLAMAYGELGDFVQSTQGVLVALALIEQSVPRFAPIAQSLVAYLPTQAGEGEKAASYGQQEKAPDPASGLYTYHYQSLAQIKLALWNDQHEAALALSEPHITLLQRNDMVPMLVDILLLRGQALAALGQNDDARAILEQARIYAYERRLQRSQWQILAALAELAETPEQALALRAEAAAVVQTIADRLPSPDLRASFLRQPEVRQVLAP